jgi:hypothetical protein
MRKLMTVMVALPLFVTTYGMSASNQVSAKDAAIKDKTGCPTGVVDRAIRKNIVPKSLIAPTQAPSAARTGGPKIKVKTPTNDKLKRPAVGSCG